MEERSRQVGRCNDTQHTSILQSSVNGTGHVSLRKTILRLYKRLSEIVSSDACSISAQSGFVLFWSH